MNAQDNEQIVNLEDFANMAGFPLELVKKELFTESDDLQNITMEELRAAMVKYIDQNMLN